MLTALIHPIAELLLISAVPQDPGPGAVRDYQKHRAIYERIRAGDAAAARAAMRRHFRPTGWGVCGTCSKTRRA